MGRQSKTLVVDSSYMPRSVISALRAFSIVYKGNAEVVSEHPETFDYPHKDLYKPSIIRVPKYVNINFHSVPLTRENIFKRDGYKCVYCEESRKKELTIDHVIPQSKGGPNTWENLVTACKKCNGEKADLTVEEYGKTIPNPAKPHYLLLLKNLTEVPEEWKPYLFLS